jgi:alcohol dehydrogenase class IV
MGSSRTITLFQNVQLTFGCGCAKDELLNYILSRPCKRIFFVTGRSSLASVEELAERLRAEGRIVICDDSCTSEPTIALFEQFRKRATDCKAECVVGFGGGSVLDLAKLVAAFAGTEDKVEASFGIELLKNRALPLVCVPTTSGTGSEVSPNAILLDESDRMKKGVISKLLVPDAAFVDPVLTLSVPAQVTAYTGVDALTHCIEAYTNKFAHPLVDMYALEGIRLISKYLVRAVKDGADLEAREGMARASMLGGLCLGPVNTAAVHALAYPLGGEYGVPHGLSNAILLPEVFSFNSSASPERHADVAVALGVPRIPDCLEMTKQGTQILERLLSDTGICSSPLTLNLEVNAIGRMADSALKVTRLLKNNPRALHFDDVVDIYHRAFSRLAFW